MTFLESGGTSKSEMVPPSPTLSTVETMAKWWITVVRHFPFLSPRPCAIISGGKPVIRDSDILADVAAAGSDGAVTPTNG